MKCSKCGSEIPAGANFCMDCGQKVIKETNKAKTNIFDKENHKKIITILIVAIIILAGGLIYISGILTPQIPLETHDFGAFTMDVPVGSNFVISEEGITKTDEPLIMYVNKGDYSHNVNTIFISKNLPKEIATETSEFIETDGNMEVYKNVTDGVTIYSIYLTEDNCQLFIFGFDLNALKRVASSFEETDLSKLSS